MDRKTAYYNRLLQNVNELKCTVFYENTPHFTKIQVVVADRQITGKYMCSI